MFEGYPENPDQGDLFRDPKTEIIMEYYWDTWVPTDMERFNKILSFLDKELNIVNLGR